jgi:aspartate/methionine/tyrosine aminotransferase
VLRFSTRTPANLEPTRLSSRIAALRAAGAPLIDLTLSNPTRAGLAYPGARILDALQDPRSLTYEPTAAGLLEARQAIATRLDADPAHILLAGSTSEAYGWLFKLLCDPGEAVMAPRPSYPLFDCLATLDAVRTVQYPLIEELRWGIDLAALERHLDPQARAIIVVNPNNPTGNYLRREDWLHLQEFAALRQLAIISDEVFFDYAWRHETPRASAAQSPHLALTFTLGGLSKTAGLPQMKLGWIHVAGPAGLRAQALERLEWIADSYLPVSAPVQHAAADWLDLTPRIQDSISQRVSSNLYSLKQAIPSDSPWRLMPASAGWCAILEAPRFHSEDEWTLLLLERHSLIVQPGYFYDFEREAFLVISLLPPEEQWQQALHRLSDIFRPD